MLEIRAPQNLSTAVFKHWKLSNEKFALLDVRESGERLGGHLGGIHIPMSNLKNEYPQLPSDLPIVVYCRSGCRSAHAIDQLQRWGFKGPLFNLEKGILGVMHQSPELLENHFKASVVRE